MIKADAPPWGLTGWSTRSELKNANRIGERGEPYARPVFASSVVSVQKSSKPMLAWQLLIKLAIHFLATIGILLTRRQVSRVTLFTLLKAPFRSNTTSVTTLFLYHAQSIALERISRACSVVLPSRPPNCVLGSRLCVSMRYNSCQAITTSSSLPSVLRSEIRQYAPGIE